MIPPVRPARWPFLIGGPALVIGNVCLSSLSPYPKHIPAFFVLMTILFAVYGGLVGLLLKSGRRVGVISPSVDVAMVLLVAVFARLPHFENRPTLSDDIFRYAWDGRVQRAGINPYLYPPAAPELAPLRNDEHALVNNPTINTPYPPLTQAAFRLTVAFNETWRGQKATFAFFDLATVLMLLALLAQRGEGFLWAAVYAWNPLVVVEFASSGHNDSLMIFCLFTAFWLFSRGRGSSGAGALGAATLSKLVPLVMVPWIAIQRRPRWMAVYIAAIVLGVALFIPGSRGILERAETSVKGLRLFAQDWTFNASLCAWLQPMAHRQVILATILMAVSIPWARKNQNDPMRYAFGGIFAFLLISPLVQPWYVVWLVPFLCFYPVLAGFVWSWAVLGIYQVLIRYWGSEHVWALSPVVEIIEYTLVYGTLLAEAVVRGRRRRARTELS